MSALATSAFAFSRVRRTLIAAALLSLTACEKVIDVDLKSADPKLVIEATLSDDGRPATAHLTQSVAYDETNTFPAVTDALVVISDDTGALDTLRATAVPGTYAGRTLLGQPGHQYTLRVESAGKMYLSIASLPVPIPLDSVRVDKVSFGQGDNFLLIPSYQDPAGVRNYYHFLQFRNGRPNLAILLLDDELTDGLRNQRRLFTMGGDTKDEDKLIPGDSVRLEMHCIDAGSYEYLRTLSQVLQSNPLFSTTPANPLTNFSGGALGFFNVYSRQEIRTRVR